MIPSTRNLLNKAFTVETLMTPKEEMTIWAIEDRSIDKVDFNNLSYDVIPVTRQGQIVGVLYKAECRLESLTNRWLITYDTGISELSAYFVQTDLPAFMVLRWREIIGVVTMADLNKMPARLYFYNIISELELALALFVRSQYSGNPNAITPLLSETRRIELEEKIANLRQGNADIDLFQLLYLSDLITIVQKIPDLRKKLGLTSRNSAESIFSGLNDLRNRSMHPVRSLLEKLPEDLHTLQGRIDRTLTLLHQLNPSLS